MLSGENVAWNGSGSRGGGKDAGQVETFIQGEQDLGDGLLHWGIGAACSKVAENRVEGQFRVGDFFLSAVPSGLRRSELGTSFSLQSHQDFDVATQECELRHVVLRTLPFSSSLFGSMRVAPSELVLSGRAHNALLSL